MNIVLFEPSECNGFLDRDDYRGKHIINVLKLTVGDTFTAGIINRDRGTAQITHIDNRKIRYTYQKKDDGNNLFPLTLLVGQVRPISMKRILREAVMLGVEKIIISGADLTEKSYEKAKIWSEAEYTQYLLDGAMQSGSSHISEVELLSCVQKVPLHYDNLILLDNVISSTPLSKQQFKGSVLAAIGPERGFSDKERAFFLYNNFTPHTIGNRILRTETAVAVTSALCLSCMNYL
jgi:16S rRNA (uracil1498-N3)-methyltransferase